jgi:hypothetical protein
MAISLHKNLMLLYFSLLCITCHILFPMKSQVAGPISIQNWTKNYWRLYTKSLTGPLRLKVLRIDEELANDERRKSDRQFRTKQRVTT